MSIGIEIDGDGVLEADGKVETDEGDWWGQGDIEVKVPVARDVIVI